MEDQPSPIELLQAARRFMDLDAGDGVYSFQEANDWVDPRRFYLGARLSF